jgi:hypothetical protein
MFNLESKVFVTSNVELLNLELLALHHCRASPTTFAGFFVQTV